MLIIDFKTSKYYSIISIILILFLANAASTRILAGPPFLSDDPEPVGFGDWEFYLASQNYFTTKTSSGTLPHLDVNYGALKNTHINIVVPMGYSHESGAATHFGLSDIEFGMKIKLFEESEFLPELGIFPHVTLPTGNKSKHLGEGEVLAFLPVWLQKTIGEWAVFGGGGWHINHGEGSKDWLFGGLVVQRDISKLVAMGAEIYYNTANKIDGNSTAGFNLGCYMNFSESKRLIFSLGKDFTADNKLNLYIAYLFTI